MSFQVPTKASTMLPVPKIGESGRSDFGWRTNLKIITGGPVGCKKKPVVRLGATPPKYTTTARRSHGRSMEITDEVNCNPSTVSEQPETISNSRK